MLTASLTAICSNKTESSYTSKYSSEHHSKHHASKGSKNRRIMTKSDRLQEIRNKTEQILDSRKNVNEREKAMGVLENQYSGNPFEDTEEANSLNMYYPEGDPVRSHSNSLNQSIRSKQEIAKSSFPDIRKNDSVGAILANNNDNGSNEVRTIKRNKNSSKMQSEKSRSKNSDMGSSVASKSKQMASYDVVPSKSLDRNLENLNHKDMKNTIMTVNEASYNANKLDYAGGKTAEMVRSKS